MANVQGARKRRAEYRLARVRLAHPDKLRHVDPSNGISRHEARRIKTVDRRYRRSAASAAPAQPKTPAFNPLAPVTPRAARREIRAQAKTQFGPQEQALRQAQANQRQSAANTATYYDDYTKALQEANARINAANDAAQAAAANRIDTAYQQDSAAVAARDQAAAARARVSGFQNDVSSGEGAQAVAAQRSQGNQAYARLRGLGAADTAYGERRSATSRLARAQALDREAARGRNLDQEAKDLAAQKGEFKVAARDKLRESERSWAAVRKEFGLKAAQLALDASSSRQGRQIDRQKIAAQKIVARMYSSANRAQARAQVRVAKLQLEKGKISKSQYRHIVNEYQGLPNSGKGVPSGDKGKGSGAGGSFLPWERDKISDAVYSLRKHNAHAADKGTWMKRMQEKGIPARLARVAWAKYRAQQDKAAVSPSGSDAAQR